jgi:hypothetical protein
VARDRPPGARALAAEVLPAAAREARLLLARLQVALAAAVV